jgi:hypothetical protein
MHASRPRGELIRFTNLCALLASTILFIYASSVCCNRYTNLKLLGKNHRNEVMINKLTYIDQSSTKRVFYFLFIFYVLCKVLLIYLLYVTEHKICYLLKLNILQHRWILQNIVFCSNIFIFYSLKKNWPLWTKILTPPLLQHGFISIAEWRHGSTLKEVFWLLG